MRLRALQNRLALLTARVHPQYIAEGRRRFSLRLVRGARVGVFENLGDLYA